MLVSPAPGSAVTTTRLLASVGALAAVACVGLVVALQVIQPSGDVLHSMISDLVFGPDPWLFDLAVLLLMAGSLAVRAALARVGLLTGSGGLMTVFAAAMAAVAAFPTCHCQVQVTASGVVHGAASVVAFVSLPLAALRLATRHTVTWRRVAIGARHVARACLYCLAPTGLAVVPIVVSVPISLPFGLFQRMAGVLAVALVVLFAGWAWSATRQPPTVDHGRLL